MALLKKESFDNNGWYSYRGNETVIIFIHGFLSNSKNCWTAKNLAYWPEILLKDEIFKNTSIFLGGYHTSIDSGGYDIAQCTAELRDSLELKKENGIAPINFPNILFICHSLGGIICRRLLEESVSKFNGKSIGILLIASPSIGSNYADEFLGLSNLYGNQIGKQLKTDGEILKDIDIRFRNLIANNPFNKFVGAETCEQHGPLKFKYLPIRMKPIVDVNSASKYFGQTRMIPETDHFSIAKPNSEKHKSHEFLQHFYANVFEPIKIKILSGKLQITCAFSRPDPLFEVYSKPHEDYYVDRLLDDQLLNQLKERSVWIFGSSGVGKTSSAKYAIDKLSDKTIEIHLGHIEEKNAKEQLLVEIICSLNPNESADGNNLHQRAIQLIRERSLDTTIPIFLDEVPISSSAINSIIAQTLGNLLDAVKQTQVSEVKFIICSIACPPPITMTSKMRERINFVEMKPWSKVEIERLFDLIANQLDIGIQVSEAKNDVVANSAGLPRFVKSFFRNVLKQGTATPDSSFALFLANQEAGN